MQFQTGGGPVGAVLFDVESGAISRLPSEVSRERFFINDTDCLHLYRRWQNAVTNEQDDSAPLSFTDDSELLIVRRCVVAMTSVIAVDKSYYRWHARKWRLLKRVLLPPPPPIPVE